jgi:hypothetical protein
LTCLAWSPNFLKKGLYASTFVSEMILIVSLLFAVLLCLNLAFAEETNAQQKKRMALEDSILFPMYPTSVPHFPVRIDAYSKDGKTPVSQGRIPLLGNIPSYYNPDPNGAKVSLAEFRKTLQCSVAEPSLDENYGTISLMLLHPPTKEALESMCAWAETRCLDGNPDWSGCLRAVESIKSRGHPPKFDSSYGAGDDNFKSFILVRTMSGKLYYDWPWGVERIDSNDFLGDRISPLRMAMSMINDLKDSAFFFGGEHPVMPWFFPFAHFGMVSYVFLLLMLHQTNFVYVPVLELNNCAIIHSQCAQLSGWKHFTDEHSYKYHNLALATRS